MEILGIGPSELLFIIIIALIVLGPKDMQKAGKTVGRWLNNLVRSDGWKAFQQTSREIRGLPTKLMREANMEIAEAEREVRKAMEEKTSYRPMSQKDLNQPKEPENTIQPPPVKPAEDDSQPDDTQPDEKNP
jgi:sec-independent protein translocase protein TatB